MASSYDNDLRLNEMATGDQSGAWGTVTNLNLEIIAEAFSYGTRAIANASTDNITLADGALDADRSMYLRLSGGGQACTVTFLPATISKVWLIENATSATLTMKQGSSPAGIAIPAGQVKMIATDGGGSTNGVVYDLLTDVNLAGTTVMSAATIDDVAIDGKVITMTGSSGDTATITVAADGALEIATTDAAAAAGHITLKPDGSLFLNEGSTAVGEFKGVSSDLVIKSKVQDKDILLKGDDGGTEITALSLDMSAGGNALFSGTVTRDLTRGSLDVGNSSGVSAPLAAGGADTVLTSNGTDISWAAAGGAFAGATVTVTANTTLSAAQNGNLVNIAATAEKIISLPAAAAGAFYVFNNDTAHTMYIHPNGSNTINGVTASLSLAPEASGILACGGSNTNWSSIGITRTMVVAKTTTIYNTTTGNGTRLTGTYTPLLGSAMLISVGSATAGAAGGTYSDSYTSGGGGGQSYSEKFIASPASSYAYEVCSGGAANPNSSFDRTTTVAGMTCTRGPESAANSWSSANNPGRSGGTATGGTVNFAGGSGASRVSVSYPGGGGGAATRAGAGGNASNRFGGGTGGNNASSSAVGAAATARNSSTYAITNSTSETYLAGVVGNNTGNTNYGNGAGPKTLVNFGSVSFTIADNDNLSSSPSNTPKAGGGSRGSNSGGYPGQGNGGYITFVEFI